MTLKDTNTWPCAECTKTFARKGDLTRHEQLHRGYRPHVCKDCGKAFSQLSGLKTHRNVHTRRKPFICGIEGCESAFGDPSSCSRHRKETHRTSGAYRCPYHQCSSHIKRRSAFISHLKKHGIDPQLIDIDSLAPIITPSSIVSTRVKSRVEGARPAELVSEKLFDDSYGNCFIPSVQGIYDIPLYTVPSAADTAALYDPSYFQNMYTIPEAFIPDLLTTSSPLSSSSGSLTPNLEPSPCPSLPSANHVPQSCAGAAAVDAYAPVDLRLLPNQFHHYPEVKMEGFWDPGCFDFQALSMY